MDDRQTGGSSSDVSIQRLGRNGYLHRVIPIFEMSATVTDALK